MNLSKVPEANRNDWEYKEGNYGWALVNGKVHWSDDEAPDGYFNDFGIILNDEDRDGYSVEYAMDKRHGEMTCTFYSRYLLDNEVKGWKENFISRYTKDEVERKYMTDLLFNDYYDHIDEGIDDYLEDGVIFLNWRTAMEENSSSYADAKLPEMLETILKRTALEHSPF
jgi:hypothetical protein